MTKATVEMSSSPVGGAEQPIVFGGKIGVERQPKSFRGRGEPDSRKSTVHESARAMHRKKETEKEGSGGNLAKK